MTLLGGFAAVATASGEGAVDWEAVTAAATAATRPGTLDVDDRERAALAADVRAARRAIRSTTGLDATVPDAVEVQDRHHWIEANAGTLRRVLAPLDAEPGLLPGVASRVNTATLAATLAVLGRAVLGQYDPGLFSDGPARLYVVQPNLHRAAGRLAVDRDRFRRWILFHEVAHAAEFGAAPWLVGHLEDRTRRAVEALGAGEVDADAIGAVDAAMTAVEGYAEFVMDRAFDGPTADLRERLDARRRGGGPVLSLLRRLLGFGMKRRQYERGKAFFEAVAAERGVEATGVVWRGPDVLPRGDEFDEPARWLARVDP